MSGQIFILGGFVVMLIILLVEIGYQRKYRVKLYNLADTIVNAACGISERTFSIFLDSLLFVLFSSIFNNLALWQIPVTPLTWILLLVVMDFIWYWYHRWGHVTRFLWAIHSLHHQSEEFNISVGFRISIFQTIFRSTFWLILPFLGFAPEAIFSVLVFHGVYQLPLHTQVVPRLGFLEYIFVTPSSHRVHHGVNNEYLDKNYGGVFIIWDILFGTYAAEKEKVVFGITERTGRLGFIRAHWHGFVQVANAVKNSPGITEAFWGKPGSGAHEKTPTVKPPQFYISVFMRNYLFFQLVGCFILTLLLLLEQKNWFWYQKLLVSTMVGWSLLAITRQRKTLKISLSVLEAIRNIVSAAIIMSFQTYSGTTFGFLATFCTLSVASVLFLPWKRIDQP
jgi:sterol desaturase/sphingolipid hydroxylase (fatty acid hydroxylase superfamily)